MIKAVTMLESGTKIKLTVTVNIIAVTEIGYTRDVGRRV
jgi:hypothetical protein